MVVQCDRIAGSQEEKVPALDKDDTLAARESAPESRVDVTVRKRLLGVLTVKRVTLIDVVAGDSYYRSTRGRRGHGDRATALTLTLRDGGNWESPGAYSPIGTAPHEMAARINEFIKNTSAPPLRMWCISWLLHLVGLLPLLIGLLCAVAGLNLLRRNLVKGRSRTPLSKVKK